MALSTQFSSLAWRLIILFGCTFIISGCGDRRDIEKEKSYNRKLLESVGILYSGYASLTRTGQSTVLSAVNRHVNDDNDPDKMTYTMSTNYDANNQENVTISIIKLSDSAKNDRPQNNCLFLIKHKSQYEKNTTNINEYKFDFAKARLEKPWKNRGGNHSFNISTSAFSAKIEHRSIIESLVDNSIVSSYRNTMDKLLVTYFADYETDFRSAVEVMTTLCGATTE